MKSGQNLNNLNYFIVPLIHTHLEQKLRTEESD